MAVDDTETLERKELRINFIFNSVKQQFVCRGGGGVGTRKTHFKTLNAYLATGEAKSRAGKG